MKCVYLESGPRASGVATPATVVATTVAVFAVVDGGGVVKKEKVRLVGAVAVVAIAALAFGSVPGPVSETAKDMSGIHTERCSWLQVSFFDF